LVGADLREANFHNAFISDGQLFRARRLSRAILPDGTVHG
jgi:uncharacterized protein YjbI with pentapeptide repeats